MARVTFLRALFSIISALIMTLFICSLPLGELPTRLLWGIGVGLALGTALITLDLLAQRTHLRTVNATMLGILMGYGLGKGLSLMVTTILQVSSISTALQPYTLELIQIALILSGIYWGTIMTVRWSEELAVSIPFVRFTQIKQKTRDLILEPSALADLRLVDLAATGLFHRQLVVPRFVLNDLYLRQETGDEESRHIVRRSLETIKKLDTIPGLEMRYDDTDFPEEVDLSGKILRLAYLLNAPVLSASVSPFPEGTEAASVITLQALSNALKPTTTIRERLQVKIQRYGKEKTQGVGYLDDGTMVVVNGGGEFMGQIISARILSSKHTPAGRMVFCNAEQV